MTNSKFTNKLNCIHKIPIGTLFDDNCYYVVWEDTEFLYLLKHHVMPERNDYYGNRHPPAPKNEYDRKFNNNYRKTKAWKIKRKSIFERDNNQCIKCNSTNRLHCHHLTYKNLGNEPLEDLITLCASCHSSLHWIEFIGEKREGF